MVRGSRLVTLLALLGLVFSMGCGPEEGGQENQNQQEEEQEQEELGDSGDFEESYDLRMNTFAFTAESPGQALNGIVEQFIEDQTYNYPIVVLMEFRDINVSDETFRIRGGAGLKTGNEEEYRWDDEFDLPDFTDGSIDADGRFTAVLPLLTFVATVESSDEVFKTLIPIRDLLIEGLLWVDEEGENPQIREGLLEGIVDGEEAADVRIVLAPGQDGIPLASVLGGESSKNYDRSGDGTNDSWLLTANYTASQTEIVE